MTDNANETVPNPDAVPDDISDVISGLLGGAETVPGPMPEPEQTPPTKPTLREQFGLSRDKIKSEAKRQTSKPTGTVPAAKRDEFIEPLEGIYAMIGMAVSAVDQPCGTAIVQSASATAEAWQELAEKDARVRKALRSLTTGSAWGGVIMAHIPILLAVTSHHMPNVLPAAMRGDQDGESSATGSEQRAQSSAVPGVNTNERRARFGNDI